MSTCRTSAMSCVAMLLWEIKLLLDFTDIIILAFQLMYYTNFRSAVLLKLTHACKRKNKMYANELGKSRQCVNSYDQLRE